MAYSVTAAIGVDINRVDTDPAFVKGMQVWGSDGKRYVYAVAGATISANTAVCSVNASTLTATASGGSYASPAVDVPSGSYAWFGAASV
jgi:hypothetical protein